MDEQFRKAGLNFTLDEWKDQWICKAGLNVCLPKFNADVRDQKATLVIKQDFTLPQYSTLRKHKMKVTSPAPPHTQKGVYTAPSDPAYLFRSYCMSERGSFQDNFPHLAFSRSKIRAVVFLASTSGLLFLTIKT